MKKRIFLIFIIISILCLSACGAKTGRAVEMYRGAYWDDEAVLIIQQGFDVDECKIMDHYNSGGIILVKDWTIANQVQHLIRSAVTTDFTEEDVAVVFYQTDHGVPAISTVGGNSGNWDSEIDDMIANAKANR